MNDIKKFTRSLVIPVLIGITIGVFTSRVIRSAFDLEYLETAIIAALLAYIVVTIFEFIKTHKKK